MYPAVENPRISGYDRSATMFSPKGRLYQVEYASKIVEQGTLGVGIIFDKGILFAADKFVVSNLTVPESIEKLFKINKFNGAISAGLVGDARRLIEFARQKVTENMSTYEEDIETEVLVRDIASIKQVFTQYGGMRPFGVSLIIGGIQNHHPRLFETEPSGALAEYKATAIGRNKKRAVKMLEDGYKENMSLSVAAKLAVNIIKVSKPKEEKFDLNYTDLATITEQEGYRVLSNKETKSILSSK